MRLLLVLGILAIFLTGCGVTYDPETGEATIPGWIAPIALPLKWGVTTINDLLSDTLGMTFALGLSIILVTILLRLILYPLTKRQMDSMRKMQEIQPQMKALQEKYGKDREKLSQKQMELYKEAGVNPAMGCLPMLIQMPILFGFYYALISLGPLLDEPFLWIPSLAYPEYQAGMSWLQPLSVAHIFSPAVLPYLVLPVIYILSQFVMQRMSQSANPTASTGPTGNIMMLMPLMFGYITLIVPSGLSLYWVTSNFIQIVQQGLTTGWGGILPSRREPALATAGVSKAASSGGPTPKPSTAGASELSSPEAEAAGPAPVSAGRRRKMRKKKR